MSLDQYKNATLTELMLATAGYWRNWERNTAWLMREIVYTLIAGNPDIKKSNKPSKQAIMPLSIDKVVKKFDEKETVSKAQNFENKLKNG